MGDTMPERSRLTTQKRPASRGCTICEECGTKRKSKILCSMQCARISPVQWLSCPSQINKRCCPAAFSRVAGSKHCFSHINPCSLLVHPFVVLLNFHVESKFRGTQCRTKVSPVKIRSGGIEDPSAQIHSIDVNHSCRLG